MIDFFVRENTRRGFRDHKPSVPMKPGKQSIVIWRIPSRKTKGLCLHSMGEHPWTIKHWTTLDDSHILNMLANMTMHMKIHKKRCL
jgi:hypothetical protein